MSKYVTEIEYVRDMSVTYHQTDESGRATQSWQGMELETAVWLVECDAVTLGSIYSDGFLFTTWMIGDEHDAPFGIEYDEWVDARWAEVMDRQALELDASEVI